MPMNNFSYTLDGNTYTDETWTADPEASLAGTANDIATIVTAVANDLANFNWGGLAGGTANALTLTPSPALGSLVAGTRYVFTPNVDNTAAATLNVSGTATDDIKRPNGDALAAGDLKAGAQAFVIFDGTNWKLTSWFPAAAAALDPNQAASNAETAAFGTNLAASDIVNKLLYRSGPTGDFVDTMASAADLVAASSEPFVTGYFPAMLINATAVKWTISGGTGVTYGSPDGASVSVPAGSARIIYIVFTNVGSGTEAVTVHGGNETTITGFPGNLSVGSNLTVGGNAAITGDLGAVNASFSGTLTGTGAATFGNSLTVGTSLTVGSDITAGGAVTAAGAVEAAGPVYAGADNVFYMTKETAGGDDFSTLALGPNSYLSYNRTTKTAVLVLDSVQVDSWG